MSYNKSTTALLLLDYQMALCTTGELGKAPALAAEVEARNVIANAKSVLDAARAAGVLVIHVRLAFDPTYKLRTNRLVRFDAYKDNKSMSLDAPEAAIVPELSPIEGEPVVNKSCVDPFIGTSLLEALYAEKIDKIIIGGVATNLVVESTARHASDSGLQVDIVEDMCASFNPAAHAFVFDNIMGLFGTVTTSSDVVTALR